MGKGKRQKPIRKNYRAMRYQMLFAIVPVLAVITLVVLSLNYVQTKYLMTKEIEAMLQAECESVAYEVQVWSDRTLATTNVLAYQLGQGYIDEEKIASFYAGTEALVEGCNSYYVIFPDGTCWSRDGVESFPEYLEEEWYLFATSCDEAAFDESSFYTEDGFTEYSVTVAKNVKDSSGKLVAVVCSDTVFRQ